MANLTIICEAGGIDWSVMFVVAIQVLILVLIFMLILERWRCLFRKDLGPVHIQRVVYQHYDCHSHQEELSPQMCVDCINNEVH